MNDDEHDNLWALLGKAREPKVPPFFANKVVRAVSVADEPRPGIFAWIRLRWFAPLAAGSCAVLVAFFALQQDAGERKNAAATADPLEGIADVAIGTPEVPPLDTLLASEDHSIWLQGDPSSLY